MRCPELLRHGTEQSTEGPVLSYAAYYTDAMPAPSSHAGRTRDTAPLSVRFSPEELRAIKAAAKAAGVPVSYYVRESTLMVAQHEGFSAVKPEGWRPSLPK